MTQQTPHERALDSALVAYCKATGINPEHRKVLMAATEQSCATYLTTLLDSPEMVDGDLVYALRPWD